MKTGNEVSIGNHLIFPIRDKLIIFFSIYTVFIFSVCIYANFYVNSSEKLFITSLDNSQKIYDIDSMATTVKYYTNKYLETGSYEDLNYYLRFSNELDEVVDGIHTDLHQGTQHILLSNIKNMVKSFLEETVISVNAKRVQDSKKYSLHLDNVNRIYELINQSSSTYLTEILKSTYDDYLKSKELKQKIKIYISIAILSIIGFAYIFIFFFSNNITKPLDKITNEAEKISKGEFATEAIKVDTKDELVVISDAFNKMSSNIKELIDEVTSKADVEKRLQEEENKNLSMLHLLKDTELQALQTQLNPHFLFNTLNVIVQTAVVEEAGMTSELIKALSNLLRYNLRKFEIPVTLREEIESVNQYIRIMKARFGSKINFELEIDEYLLEKVIPRMLIQPLIENSVIHGFNSDLLESITILISVTRSEEIMLISVTDNGVGIPEDVLDSLLNNREIEKKRLHKGHTTGIGIDNIRNRLTLLYGKNIVEIGSRAMAGTKIVIKLPLEQVKGENYV